MPHDLRDEAREALETATKNVQKLPVRWNNDINVLADNIALTRTALISLLNVSSQLARIVGVPNAIEPETGSPRVTTKVE